ncbi:MAG: hypothetical protein HQ572_00955, partial [Candidatus Omnitrophica bacterium]|nr:hypothetical protein [Candidatus Omnitrophota bacterium]
MKKFIYKNRDVIIVSLVLIALLCIVFKDIIFSDYVFVRRDIARIFYPTRNFVAQELQAGRIPLWNPYIFCGIPLLANIHSSVFYPLSVIYYFMDVAKGLSLFIIFHIFLSGLFMYLFMKSLNISKSGSFLAGFSFAFSGYIMATINLMSVLCSVAWFPLVMLLFIKGIKEQKTTFSIWLGIVLVLMFLAGGPTITMATLAIMFLSSSYLVVERFIKTKNIDRFILYNILISSGLFLLLTAFQILPAIEYYAGTTRAK